MRNLKKLRRDSGLTQYSLASATGIPRVKISHAELGIVKLTADEVASIRKVLLKVSQNNSARVLAALGDGPEQKSHTRLRSERPAEPRPEAA
jgi:transcriptional regulator with XRE-family HTH domain